jgi:hypothetical protein
VRHFSRVTTLAAAAIAVVASMFAPPAEGSVSVSDPGHIGIRLVDIPVDLLDDSRAREYIIDGLSPGVTVHRRIELANTTTSPVHLDLYSGAADITHGSFTGAPGAAASDLTAWTTLSEAGINLLPKTTAVDTITIAVPKDAAPGERYGVVWAQVNGKHGEGVTLVNRVGVRIYLWVGGNNPPASDFAVDTITASRLTNGGELVQALVHNTGGRAIDLTGTLTLAAVHGSLTAGPYPVQLGTTLAPGQSGPVRVMISYPLDDGPWNATLDLRDGALDKSFQAQIAFPRHAGTAPPVTVRVLVADDHMTLIYVLSSVLGAILLGALIFFFAARRRSRRRTD